MCTLNSNNIKKRRGMDGDWYRMSNKWDGVIYSITLHSKNSKTESTKVKKHDLIRN